jgi:hypothetical protein
MQMFTAMVVILRISTTIFQNPHDAVFVIFKSGTYPFDETTSGACDAFLGGTRRLILYVFTLVTFSL